MLKLILILVAVVGGAFALFVFISLCWAASGSPDVNGDPQRDGGMPEDEIRALSAHWDHGSHRTANLLALRPHPTSHPIHPHA